MNDNFSQQTIKIHWYILSIFFIVLLFGWTYTLPINLGYLIGSCLSYLAFEIRNFFMTQLFKLKKSGFVNAILNFCIILLIIAAVLACLIIINTNIWKTSFSIFFPINIIAFSLGLLNIHLAFIVNNIFWTKFKRKGVYERGD